MSEAKRCEILLLDDRKLEILVQVRIFVFHRTYVLYCRHLFRPVWQTNVIEICCLLMIKPAVADFLKQMKLVLLDKQHLFWKLSQSLI